MRIKHFSCLCVVVCCFLIGSASAVDFGDAPLPYLVTLSEGGARHEAIGPTLGFDRDSESDGIHSAAADADDTNGIDDEDGVSFGTIQVGRLGVSVTVNVQNAPGGARLDAWMDFNGDGCWGGPFEQIADNVAVVAGDNTIMFDVPSWALDGQSYARFRLSTAGDLAPGGPAADGEVEDYQVVITAPTISSGLFGKTNCITSSANGAYSVFAADVDGDDDMDVLAATIFSHTISWYENDGSDWFRLHYINIGMVGFSSIFVADVDGDGDMDVLSTSVSDDTIAWYENDPNQNFTAHVITTDADGAQSVFAADVDGDGDTDVLSASSLDDRIAWYENDGSENFTAHTITTNASGAQLVFAADVDSDGDMDVLSEHTAMIAWYENDGSENFSTRTIAAPAFGGFSMFVADVDSDGDMDVLSVCAFHDTITWYENDGSETFTAHTITEDAAMVQSVFAADMDGDGDMDVLSASRDDNKIAWYENDGSENFTAHTITTDADEAQSVFAADVDGDGDLDVLSASCADDTVAWYENLGFDFGDAPASYLTTLSEDGARHVETGPRLGDNRDSESNGTHSPAADADDTTDIDDEDGVSFGTIQTGQLGATVTVNVQNAGGGAKLDAWMDFNGDGCWGGTFEQIADNVTVADGNNIIIFDVPSWAIVGQSYARFRLSTAGDLAPGGVAPDGEVEDYQVTITAPVEASGVFGDLNVITTYALYATSVFASDMDGDGDMDVLAANDGSITWYENDGNENFTAHTITMDADGVQSVFAADVDGDGDMDVLAAIADYNRIAWYKNDGNENFTAHIITMVADGANSVFAADMDGDGDMDVLSASYDDDKIAWYENDGSENFTAHIITTDALGAYSVFAADVDGDGDMDVLSASYSDHKIAWYANDGSENFTGHTIATDADNALSVFAADVDGDGDMDVLSASWDDDTIAWYENDGSENFTAHIITTDAEGAELVSAADMDGDGDMDVISASYRDNTIAWYKNDGIENFTTCIITEDANGAQSVFAADVDGDGDLDVLSASFDDDKIAWYENLGFDFGDAPEPYPTARHRPTGPRFGYNRDDEQEGMHSAAADADDTTDIDDEDGVSFGTIQAGRLGASVTVNVQNCDPNAKLDAWIDFNGDGCWGGPFEQIADNVTVTDGNNIIIFDVPSWAINGQSYARFRLSTAGDLAPGGLADDGEVEDYQVTITDPAAASGVFDSQNVITTTALGAVSVFAADVDGDGDLDVLSASLYDTKIAWYENDPNQNFTAHTITTDAVGVQMVFAADVDGDGDMDVLSAFSNTIAWYENDPNRNFTAHTITTAIYGAESVFAADVDGDGDMDVLSASYWDNMIAWYKNDGREKFTANSITTEAYGAYSVFAADMDSDGDMDVLSASYRDYTIAWYANDGSENFTAHTITTEAYGVVSVFAADIDGDGDMDVLSASEFVGTAWYKNDGSENFTAHTIDEGSSRSVLAADVDGDGDMDVLSTSSPADIAWYENDGSENFRAHANFPYANGVNSVFAADVDGDGDLDVLSASHGDNMIAWYENLAVDFGDAPAPYHTMHGEDGARHTATGPRLGDNRDFESDGTHSVTADADDTTGTDDEDGVSFALIRAGQLGASVTVNVQNDPNAKLDAWIDFNGDGDWDDPLEQIADNVSVADGNNVIIFDVPGWATEGQTYSRFRLSTAGDLAPDGAAADGEVEDYFVTIAPYCVVDFEDLDYFVNQWLVSGDVEANFDWDDNPVPDNRVDLYDFSYLTFYWMMWCPEGWPWE